MRPLVPRPPLPLVAEFRTCHVVCPQATTAAAATRATLSAELVISYVPSSAHACRSTAMEGVGGLRELRRLKGRMGLCIEINEDQKGKSDMWNIKKFRGDNVCETMWCCDVL